MKNFTIKLKLILTCLTLVVLTSKTFAQITGTGSTLTITNNTASVVDNSLSITTTGNITNMTVQISDGYISGSTGDILSYTGTLPSGVSASFDNTTGVLKFTGTASVSAWQTLLRTVTLKTTSATCYPEKRNITFVLGNKFYNPLTGHYYEFYATTTSWTAAKTYADGQSYYGRKGYLATITSAAENNFIWKIMNQNSWMGLSDDYSYINAATGVTTYANQTASEGHFYWVTGPEAGTNISNGNGSPSIVSGKYANWTSGEPNNLGNENYGHLYSGTNGLWNDFANSQSITSVIEYGDMANDITTNNVAQFTRSIFVSGASSGTITGGGVSVCTGTNSTVLTLTGLTGTVVRWEYSYDNFLTTGVNISNTTTSYTATNLTQTTYYRAVVNSSSPNSCSNLPTSSTTITITSSVGGNITAASSTICGGGAALLTLSGNQGDVVKWQRSTVSNFASSVTDIANTTVSLSDVLSTNGTYYYRAVVQKSGCSSSAYSSTSTITVVTGTPSVGGSINTLAYCGGSNSGTLTLSGKTGNVTKWQSSTDNGLVWSDISNSNSTYSFSNITATTLYRAVVQNGTCATSNSLVGMVDVTSQSGTWLGNTSSDWQTGSNWCGGVPTSTTNVIIPAGRANNPVLSSGTGYCNNITINSGATVTVSSTLKIYGSISQNGTLTATSGTISFDGSSAQTIPASTFASNTVQNLTINNTNGLTLSSDQIVTGTLTLSSGLLNTSTTAKLVMSSTANAISGASTSRYINGPITKIGTSAYVFPVGKAGKYAPCEISAPATSTEFTAEYFKNAYSNLTKASGLLKVSDREYWNIDRTNGSAAVDVTLYYLDGGFSVIQNITANDLVVAHFNSTISKWEKLAGATTITGTVSSGTVKLAGVNNFSPFTFGSSNAFNPLPVKLISFEAKPIASNKTSELTWSSASEENCTKFEVLYSTDLKNWSKIGEVACAGLPNQINNYSFIHQNPATISYYRLNQIDANGQAELTDIRKVEFTNNVVYGFNAYPNPSTGNVTIENTNFSETENPTNYQITDISGKVIETGVFNESLSLTNLPKGILIIKLEINNVIQTKKLIIN